MERGIFLQRLQGGLKEWPGVQIILQGARIGGSWSFWYEGHFKCGGFNARDRICVKDLDAKFDQYERSINPAERKKLAEEIQRGILENYYLVPVFRHAFVNAIGPRVAGAEVAGRLPDHHHRLRLSVGGHQGEGAVARSAPGCRSSSSAASSTASSRSAS